MKIYIKNLLEHTKTTKTRIKLPQGDENVELETEKKKKRSELNNDAHADIEHARVVHIYRTHTNVHFHNCLSSIPSSIFLHI
jgi:hypothetical protein